MTEPQTEPKIWTIWEIDNYVKKEYYIPDEFISKSDHDRLIAEKEKEIEDLNFKLSKKAKFCCIGGEELVQKSELLASEESKKKLIEEIENRLKDARLLSEDSHTRKRLAEILDLLRSATEKRIKNEYCRKI